MLEEGVRRHSVMRAILEGHTRYVVSNNLHALERGGESFDCIYKKATAPAERSNRPPFGLVMLYTRREYGFESFDERFLSKCASIVALS